jgi:Lrp/AsnC family transcriptional regulator
MSNGLTDLDFKILEEVQRDSSLSTADLAERVGLSQSPCWRRLQRLKDEGYIRGEVALVDRRKFGLDYIIFAHLKMATLTPETRAEFLDRIATTPEILECHTIFGEMDVILKVIAPSVLWYQNFIFNTILKLPGVLDIQSTVTLSELKYETALPVRGEHGG